MNRDINVEEPSTITYMREEKGIIFECREYIIA